MKVTIQVDKFIAWLNANKNQKGNAYFDIKKSQKVGQYGDTHYGEMWIPENNNQQQSNNAGPPQEENNAGPGPGPQPPKGDDDLGGF